MEDETNKNIGASKCEVESTSDHARTTVLAERSCTALVTANRVRGNKKER